MGISLIRINIQNKKYQLSKALRMLKHKASSLISHKQRLWKRIDDDAEDSCHAYHESFRYEIPGANIRLNERANYYCHPVGDGRLQQQI